MRIKSLIVGLLGLLMVGVPSMALAEHRFPYRGPADAPPPPPPEHVETRVGWVWVGGHYQWHRGHYEWMNGRMVRERHGREWREGRWEHHGASWRWHDGSWHLRR